MHTAPPTDLAKIVDKIHKLAQITTERGASEAEAALAAGHIQRLLAEHNLEMATIEAAGGSSGDAGKRERGRVSRRQVYRWQRTLMEAIAKLNYCHLTLKWQHKVNTSRTFDGYELVGRAANVAAASHTFEYLVVTIERLLRDDVKGDASQFFTRYAHSYKEGCSDRLVQRLESRYYELAREARENAETRRRHNASTANALITLDDVERNETDLNQDFILNREPGTTARLRAEQHAKSAADAAARIKRKEELIQAGTSPDVADWMSWGYSRENAEQMCKPEPQRVETDTQRRKREAKEERERERRYARYEAQDRRERERLDQRGYQRGNEAGKTIGLDPQVQRGTPNRRIGS